MQERISSDVTQRNAMKQAGFDKPKARTSAPKGNSMACNQVHSTLDCRTYVSLAILATLLLIALMSGAAQAQSSVDADLQRYCRERFPNSIYEKRAERWGVGHYCNQGGTRQNIDFAVACQMTTGSRAFRRDGERIYCTDSGKLMTEMAATGVLDLQRYCRETFPNSAYEHRAESWGITHYCRRPGATGAFSLQQINLAKACGKMQGTTEFQKQGDRVVCVKTGSYTWPKTGYTFHGPLKNGKPHGIGWMKIPPTASTWVGEYDNGKPVGPHLQRAKGHRRCWNFDNFNPGRVLPKLPMARCAHLRGRMAAVP